MLSKFNLRFQVNLKFPFWMIRQKINKMLSTDSGIWLSGDSVMLGNQYLVFVSFGNFFLPIISLLLLKQLFVGHWTDNELHTKRGCPDDYLLLHQTGQFQFQFSYLQDFFCSPHIGAFLSPNSILIQEHPHPQENSQFNVWFSSELDPPFSHLAQFNSIIIIYPI